MTELELQALTSAELDRRWTELVSDLEEMPSKLEEAYQELFNLRFRLATRQLEDTSQLRKARKAIARLKTAVSAMQREGALIELIRREREGQ